MKFVDRMVRAEPKSFPPLIVDNIKDPVALSRALCDTSGVLREKAYRYPRISQVESMCAREWVFGMSGTVKKSEYVHFPLKMVFGIGSGIHEYYQNSQDLFPNIVGNWICLSCDHKWVFTTRPLGSCPVCGANNKAVVYSEHYFSISEPFYATGKIDLFLPVGNPVRFRIGDIKGVADDKVEPRGSDVIQLAAYLLCAKYDDSLSDLVDTTTGYLFYVAKKMSFKAPVRTIKVVLTPFLEKTILETFMQVKMGVDEGKIPPKKVGCKDKNCPFIVQCNEYGDRDDFLIPAKIS